MAFAVLAVYLWAIPEIGQSIVKAKSGILVLLLSMAYTPLDNRPALLMRITVQL